MEGSGSDRNELYFVEGNESRQPALLQSSALLFCPVVELEIMYDPRQSVAQMFL
ncbi:hypothetical protein Goklo_023062, partial [Gossypium klotzschianum]|nr:hypothetical protein [Gossypium klotzschianum]